MTKPDPLRTDAAAESAEVWSLIDRIYQAGLSPADWPALLEGFFQHIYFEQAGALTADTIDEFESKLLPHFERAIALNRHIEDQSALGQNFEPVLSAFSFPLLIIDAHQQVLYMSDWYQTSPDQLTGIDLDGGFAKITDARLSAEISALIDAVPNPETDVHVHRLHLSDGSPVFAIRIQFAEGRIALALAQFGAGQTLDATWDSLGESFELTSAELDTLKLMLSGHSSREVMSARGVAENTFRGQLKTLMSKTGTHSQAQMLRKALYGPMLIDRYAGNPKSYYRTQEGKDGRRHQSLELADGRRLGLAEYGPTDGRPVIFEQNLNGSRRQLPCREDDLYDQNVRLLVFDRDGVGFTDRQVEFTLAQTAADVAWHLDQLGLERVHVVGCSVGGIYALSLGAYIPERVAGIAVVGGMGELIEGETLDAFDPTMRMMFTVARRAPRALRFLVRIMRRDDPETYLKRSLEDLTEVDRDLYRDPAFHDLMKDVLTDMARRDSRCIAHDLELMANPWPFRVEILSTPVTWWHGEADTTSPFVKIGPLVERIPGCGAVFMRDETHLLVHRHWHTVVARLFSDASDTDQVE